MGLHALMYVGLLVYFDAYPDLQTLSRSLYSSIAIYMLPSFPKAASLFNLETSCALYPAADVRSVPICNIRDYLLNCTL